MAKGRKLTTSHSERYHGSSRTRAQSNGSSAEISEFREEDVWSVVDSGSVFAAAMRNDEDDEDPNSYQQKRSYASGEWESCAGGGDCWRASRPSRLPKPRKDRQVGGLSVAFEDSGRTPSRIVHQHRTQDGVVIGCRASNNNSARKQHHHHMAMSAPVNVPDWKKTLGVDSAESLDVSDGSRYDYGGELAVDPPHEYLARSQKTAAKSVFKGVGRTLKWRDMSRLRDAVWSQTGFDG